MNQTLSQLNVKQQKILLHGHMQISSFNFSVPSPSPETFQPVRVGSAVNLYWNKSLSHQYVSDLLLTLMKAYSPQASTVAFL